MTTTFKPIIGIVFLIGSALLLGCESTMNTTGALESESRTMASSNTSNPLMMSMENATTTAANDGLNQLDISDIAATNFVTAGTGTASRGLEEITIDVPEGADVEAVYLYWARLDYDYTYLNDPSLPDPSPSTIMVNGTVFTGEKAGGPVDNPNQFHPLETKAGITHKLNLTFEGYISAGTNTITVQDDPESGEPLGASLIVFYSIDGADGELLLFDGADYLWAKASSSTPRIPGQRPALQTARPVTFTFEPAEVDRTADLALFIGDVEPEDAAERPNSLNITIGDGPTQVIGSDPSPFQGFQGPEWDNYEQSLNIPAGVSEVTVEPVSGPDGERPASLLWSLAGLSIQNPVAPPPCKCEDNLKKLSLKYTGKRTAKITVKQKNGQVVYHGFVKPNKTFSFKGRYRDGTLGSEVKVYVNWKKDATIKTDCSKLYPGKKEGSFTVVNGYDKKGNELCPPEKEKCDKKHKKWDKCDKDHKWGKWDKWDKDHKWDKWNKDNKKKNNRWYNKKSKTTWWW